MSVPELARYIKFFQPSVKTFAIRGNLEEKGCSEFTKNFLKIIMKTCTQLKELVIEDYYINGAEVRIFRIFFIFNHFNIILRNNNDEKEIN